MRQKGSSTMTNARVTVSGFGDEISADPAEQLAVLANLGIHHLDLRGAWDRNILDFSPDDIANLKGALATHGAQVAMIASPVGKSQISESPDFETGRLQTVIRLADQFDTPLIRMFSFYHEGIAHAACRDEVISRLSTWARTAERAGVTLLLENEGGLWTDRPEQCLDVLESINSPALRMTLDTGNFASLGIASADVAYPLLKPWISHIQIKDMVTATHTMVTAGQGDAQLPQVLAAALADGYRGYLSLEPHLAVAGKAGGFSGPALFSEAARALHGILATLPMTEVA
jgi:sugar phosphate isomerase/epimerase